MPENTISQDELDIRPTWGDYAWVAVALVAAVGTLPTVADAGLLVGALLVYLHADLTIEEQALARAAPASSRPGRYRPPDALLAFLESL